MITGRLVAGGRIYYSQNFDKDGKANKTVANFTQFSHTVDPEEVKEFNISAETLGTIIDEIEKLDISKMLSDFQFKTNQGWKNFGIEVQCPGNPLVMASLTPVSNAATWGGNEFLVSFFLRKETGEMSAPEREVAPSETPIKKEGDELAEGKIKNLVIEAGEPDGDYDVDAFKAIEKAIKSKGLDANHTEFDKYQGVFLLISNKKDKFAKYWHVDTHVVGTPKKPSGKYKDAYLINDDGDKSSANSGDYFMMSKNQKFDGSTLVLIMNDGSKKEIENPKKSDLPDLSDIGKLEFEGEPDQVMTFNLEGDDTPIEVRFSGLKPDVSELVDSFKSLSESFNNSSNLMTESLDIFGMPILK